MFWKFLGESLWRPGSRHHALWAVLAVALGTAIAAAMLNVSLEVGDKMGRELRSLGANIVITSVADSLPVEIGGIDYRPVSEGSYIAESALPKLKEIFWRNNLAAFAPFLFLEARVFALPASPGHNSVGGLAIATTATVVGTWFQHSFVTSSGEHFQTGVRALNPTWKLEGEWVDDSGPAQAGSRCLVGEALAMTMRLKTGDAIAIQPASADPTAPTPSPAAVSCTISGVLTTGGAENQEVLISLAVVQALSGLEGKARKIEASALIKQEDEKSRRDPKSMTPAEYERWYCSPYMSSILLQIGEALPGTVARQIRPVAETEGRVLGKLTYLMATLALLALVAAGMSISSIASLRVLKRRQEISLMMAIGAQQRLVAWLFLAEAALQGLAGGALGFSCGLLLANVLDRLVFDSGLTINWILLPVILMTGLIVSFAGTWGPLQLAMNYDPASVLRGE